MTDETAREWSNAWTSRFRVVLAEFVLWELQRMRSNRADSTERTKQQTVRG